MPFDRTVPPLLKNTQQWFASIITSPIDTESKMNPVSPRGKLVKDEALDYIAPSPTLEPYQRIQIYNQQYWWRLMSTLQDSFPLVLRLFGYEDFNMTIAMPYLQKYPPTHWSLTFLGQHMVRWIDEDYDAQDKDLIRDCALLDWSYNCIFIAGKHAALEMNNLAESKDPSSLLEEKLSLQPYIDVFSMKHNLFEFRQNLLKEIPEYWVDNDFPELLSDKNYFFVLFRTKKNNISWDEISQAEYLLLSQFKNGATIDEACAQLEEKGDNTFQDAEKHISSWFQSWVVRQWLVPS